MLTTLRNAWKIADLRKKILFTLLIIVIYRIGNAIPVPFVNVEAMAQSFEAFRLNDTIFGMFDMMSGSAFSQATIFALSIQPYINASIIIQLLTIAIPALERLSKEGGEEGKKTINRITRYATVALAVLMGFAYWWMLKNYNAQSVASGYGALLTQHGFLSAVAIILTFTAGSSLVMWLGDQITESGIGNGISMILFANIIARIPSGIVSPMVDMLWKQWYWVLALVVGMLALIVFIIFVSQAERRIPVQYAKRVVGRKVYGGQSTHLPIKVNMSGVMPVIFAQSIASLPATIATFAGASTNGWWYKNVFSSTSWVYTVVYLLLIVGFSYFYATIQYNPVEVSNNLKKNGGFIPGFRPGRPTADFIRKVINKTTLFGALYLGVIAVLPIVVGAILGDSTFSFGGTSVIIVVSVALETVAAIEAQMMMRNYSGFLEK